MQRRNIPFGQAVNVLWQDSSALSGWNSIRVLRRIARVRSLGYVVESNLESLVVTTSISDQRDTMDDLIIPWKCIEELGVIDLKAA